MAGSNAALTLDRGCGRRRPGPGLGAAFAQTPLKSGLSVTASSKDPSGEAAPRCPPPGCKPGEPSSPTHPPLSASFPICPAEKSGEPAAWARGTRWPLAVPPPPGTAVVPSPQTQQRRVRVHRPSPVDPVRILAPPRPGSVTSSTCAASPSLGPRLRSGNLPRSWSGARPEAGALWAQSQTPTQVGGFGDSHRELEIELKPVSMMRVCFTFSLRPHRLLCPRHRAMGSCSALSKAGCPHSHSGAARSHPLSSRPLLPIYKE